MGIGNGWGGKANAFWVGMFFWSTWDALPDLYYCQFHQWCPCVLCPQHTAQAVLAAAHPAPCLLTLHRRGGRQLQSQQQPCLKPPPQTHAPLLQGHGLWSVSSTTALHTEEQTSVWNPTDWAISAMNRSVWVTWGKGGREGGPPRTYIHNPPPIYVYQNKTDLSGCEGGFGGRVGLKGYTSGHLVILTHPQCPPRSAFILLLFPCTCLPVPGNYKCNRGCQLS